MNTRYILQDRNKMHFEDAVVNSKDAVDAWLDMCFIIFLDFST